MDDRRNVGLGAILRCPGRRSHDWECICVSFHHEDSWIKWLIPCGRDTCPGNINQRDGIYNWIVPCNDGKKDKCPGWSLASHKYDDIKREWAYVCLACGATKYYIWYTHNFSRPHITSFSQMSQFQSVEYYIPTATQAAGTLDAFMGIPA